MSKILTDHEAEYYAALLRMEAAKSREVSSILETVANALHPRSDLPEPSRSSHQS